MDNHKLHQCLALTDKKHGGTCKHPSQGAVVMGINMSQNVLVDHTTINVMVLVTASSHQKSLNYLVFTTISRIKSLSDGLPDEGQPETQHLIT